MPKKKKSKKSKKASGPEIRTTQTIINERAKMYCPRMGDKYNTTMRVEEILEDVAYKTLEKCAQKRSEQVSLSGMRLNYVPDMLEISRELSILVDVNLSRNQLFNGIEVFEVLAQLRQLRKLNLSDNCLNGVLPPEAGEMLNIEVLHLDNNQLISLPSSIKHWTKLKVLTIGDNSITSLPKEVAEWPALQYINAKHNKLKELPEGCFRSWPQLERLYLSGNQLTEISDDIGYCQRLTEADFSNNMIEIIPTALSMCSALVLLHLGANKISNLPTELFCMLTNLRELQLYKNKLTQLPPEIGNLILLKRLSLSSNNLRTLPEEIGACTALRELYINNNAKFAMLPGTAGHLRKLQELSMRKCPALKQLPATTQDMAALRELDVRAPKKQVCKIPPEVAELLKNQHCIIRGGVVKKAKGKKAK